MKYTKLLLIEDGSVDMTLALAETLDSMGIYPITYRQGATPPQLIDLCQTPKCGQTNAIGFMAKEADDV